MIGYSEEGKSMIVGVIIILIIFFILPAFSWADSKTFPRDYTYQAGEADSKVSSRSVAMEQVKRLLLEEIGTYIESHTEVKNFELTKDQITALTAGIVKLKIVDEKWDGEKYWLKAEIVVDPDDVTKKIDTLRQDREKVQELEDAKKRVEELLKENESLRKSSSKTDRASVKLYQENVKSLETAEMIREANALVSAGNLRKALEVMNEAVGMEPKNPNAYGMRGYVFRKMGKNGEAIKDLNKGIELKPDLARAYFERGFIYSEIGETEKSIQDYSKDIELRPKLAVSYNNRGNCYTKLRQYEKALMDFNESLARNPKYALAYRNRGLCYFNIKKYDEAIEDYNQAIALEPKQSKSYYFRGNVHLEQKKYDEALIDYSQAISLSPDDKLAYANRGLIHMRLKKLPEALADYNKSLLLDPDHARTYYNRSIVYNKLGKKGQEMADLKKAASLGHEGAKNVLNKKEAGANVGDGDMLKVSSITPMESDLPDTVGISISGSWTSSEGGSLAIQQTDTEIQATFPVKNGRIMGKLNGNTMAGYWVQDSSGRRCSYQKDNSFYWGKIVLNFTPRSFSGYWGYCEDEPRSGWRGVRK